MTMAYTLDSPLFFCLSLSLSLCLPPSLGLFTRGRFTDTIKHRLSKTTKRRKIIDGKKKIWDKQTDGGEGTTLPGISLIHPIWSTSCCGMPHHTHTYIHIHTPLTPPQLRKMQNLSTLPETHVIAYKALGNMNLHHGDIKTVTALGSGDSKSGNERNGHIFVLGLVYWHFMGIMFLGAVTIKEDKDAHFILGIFLAGTCNFPSSLHLPHGSDIWALNLTFFRSNLLERGY
ncbi:hypothetical protein V8C35DRAFT_48404 [Trichoderma chlorosporum]